MKPNAIVTAVLTIACVAGALASLGAQPRIGDVLVASTGVKRGIFYPRSRVFGLAQWPGTNTLWPSAVAPSIDNNGMSMLTTLSRAFIRFAPTGAATQIVPFPLAAPTDLAVDQNGDWILPAGDGIYRLRGTALSRWATAPGTVGLIDRDLDTGDFLVGQESQGLVMRLDRATRLFATIATGLGTFTMTGLAYNPVTGDIAVSRFGNRNGLVLIPRRGLRRVVAISNALCVTAHPWTGEYWVGTLDGRVIRVAPNGAVLGTTNYGSDYVIRDLAFYGTRNVYLDRVFGRGNNVDITIRFGRSSFRPYCAALALSNRNGPQLSDGRRLWLAPDALLFATVCRDLPGITTGFVGTLDRGGTAVARVVIPAVVPLGTLLYVAAAAVNPNLPDGLDVSNGEVVSVTP